MTAFTIDIDKVLREKAGAKARFVPRFVVSWLKHIVHQDELNDFFMQVGDKVGVPWLDDCLDYLQIKICKYGEENLPPLSSDGRYTFVSNHPLGGIDGIALGSILGHHYDGHIRYLVNDLLMNLHGLAPLCVGINKFGSQGHNFAKQVNDAFASDNQIIMFPAAICSRRINGQITDLPWKKSFISKSIQAKRDIVPIHFGGQNSNFFYRLANVSKALGIKFNIAMLFLADEMFKNRGSTFHVSFGKPIPWETFDSSRTPDEWAQYVRSKAYELPFSNNTTSR